MDTMVATLAVSSIMLTLLLAAKHVELRFGKRYFVGPRELLDRSAAVVIERIKMLASRTVRYAHVDILMQGLHMVTYGALVFVRWLERRLVHAVGSLRRSYKRNRRHRAPSHRLMRIREQSGE